MDQRFAPRGIAEPLTQNIWEDIRHAGIDELYSCIHGTANGARAECADSFIDGNDAANFGGVRLTVAEHFELRVDHFESRGAHFVDFGFAVKDELLPGFEAAFEIAAVKEFAGKEAAGGILYEQMIDGVVGELIRDSLAAHHARANRVCAGRLDVFDIRELDSVFVAERQVGEQVLKRMNAALGEKFGALRADAFDHAHFGCQAQRH